MIPCYGKNPFTLDLSIWTWNLDNYDFYRQLYTDETTGNYFKVGDIIRRPKLAETLQKIGQSGTSDIFYKGKMGQSIVKELSERGGIITEEDFRNYE